MSLTCMARVDVSRSLSSLLSSSYHDKFLLLLKSFLGIIALMTRSSGDSSKKNGGPARGGARASRGRNNNVGQELERAEGPEEAAQLQKFQQQIENLQRIIYFSLFSMFTSHIDGIDSGALEEEQIARKKAEEVAQKQAEEVARKQTEATAAAFMTSVHAFSSDSNEQVTLISKPRGSAGDGYRLIEEMGLTDDKITYNAIIVSVSIIFSFFQDYSYAYIARLRYMSSAMELDWIGITLTHVRVKRGL